MAALRHVATALATAGLLACSSTTDAPQPTNGSSGPTLPTESNLRLTTDSARVYTLCTAPSDLYCFVTVPDSGTMTGDLTVGPETNDLSAPVGGLGTIVKAYSNVVFADSLAGKAVIDTDSIITVYVQMPWSSDKAIYDFLTLTGKITNGRYTGRWSQQLDPHGRGRMGSFVTF